jgi:hypothetical protein
MPWKECSSMDERLKVSADDPAFGADRGVNASTVQQISSGL